MSLNYEKIKKKHDGDSFWTSYADLATVLTVIFLAMYAVATLRTTTVSVAERATNRVAQKQIDDLKEQIRTYDVLKDEYLKNGASNGERQMYQELLSQMKLMEQEAKSEKEELIRQAEENDRKAKGLNRYQSQIKNIIIANMLAQRKLKGRDEVIVKKTENIDELKKDVSEREAQIAQNNQEIDHIQQKLQKSISDLKSAYKSKARNRKEMESKIAKLKAQSQEKIAALRNQNQSVEGALESAKAQINEQTQILAAKENALADKQKQLKQLEGEKSQMESKLANEQARYQSTLAEMRAAHEASLEQERQQYQQNLNRELLTAQQKIDRERAYLAKVEEEKNAYNARVKEMSQALAGQRAEAEAKARELEHARTVMSAKERELAQQRAEAEAKARELEGTRQQMTAKERELYEKERALAGTRQQMSAKERELAEQREAAAQAEADYQAKLAREKAAAAGMASDYQAKLAREKAAAAGMASDYQAKLAREKAAAEQAEAEYQAKLAREKAAAAGMASDYQSKLAREKAAASAMESDYQGKLAAAEKEKGRMLGELQSKERGFRDAMGKLEADYNDRLAASKKAFEDGLAKEKLSAEERLGKERAYRAAAEAEKAAYDSKMQSLAGQLAGTRSAIAAKEKQYQDSLGKLSNANQGLEREVANFKAREAAKRMLAEKIKNNFKKAGIDAAVDPRTGEVTLNFGEEYFDYGSSRLKMGMQKILQRAIPLYAQSILEDPAVAQRISNVEITGFASPTFKGKYVNPKDLSPDARRAVNYNLDLSYQRAKSIFEYVFDQDKLKYNRQRELLSLAKVTGQGYLRAQVGDSNMSDDEYCLKYDCTKSQKVLIKFNFAEK